jgi:hypothetical protein
MPLIDDIIDRIGDQQAMPDDGALVAARKDIEFLIREAVEAEREACARVAETLPIVEGEPTPEQIDEMKRDVVLTAEAAGNITARRIARAIRSRGPSREGEAGTVKNHLTVGSVIDPAWQLVPKEPTCAPISYRWLLKEPVGAEDWHYGDWPTADAAKRFAWNAVGHRTERADFEAAFVIEPLYVSPPAPRALLKEAVETSYATMTALRGLLSSTPAMQSRDFIGMGIKLNDAIDKARAALSSTASGGENG